MNPLHGVEKSCLLVNPYENSARYLSISRVAMVKLRGRQKINPRVKTLPLMFLFFNVL